MVIFLAGCTEYALEKEAEAPDDAGGTPDITADPGEVTAVGHCDTADTTVEIRNVGDATLTLTAIEVVGRGWEAEHVGLPYALGAGEATGVILSGGDGDAALVIESDDPDTPTLEVPLSATSNSPPEVAITSPAGGDVVGEAVDLTGTVRDDVDAPTELVVVWSDDAGDFAAGCEADGTTAATWTPPAAGDVGVTLSATDTCGETTSASVTVCRDASTTYDAFDLTGWHYEGVAAYDSTSGYLVLTGPDTDVVGTAFETSTAVAADNVSIDFLFYIGGGSGADGISLTALDTTRMSTYLGGTGCGIGYGGDASCTVGPALPGWSIEVDTYYNSEADRGENDHVAFTFDGDVDGYVAYAETFEMEDSGWHEMVVTVVAPHVTASIDGITYIDEDLSGNFAFPGYVGFTAGTGGATNYHLIDALTVTEQACD